MVWMCELCTDRNPKTQRPPRALAHEGPRGLLLSPSALSDGGRFSLEGKLSCMTPPGPEVWANPLTSVSEWLGLPDPPMPNLGAGACGAGRPLSSSGHCSSAPAGQWPEEGTDGGMGGPHSISQQQRFAASPWSRAEHGPGKGTRESPRACHRAGFQEELNKSLLSK